MKKTPISNEIIQQLESLAQEAADWAKRFDNNTPKIDLRYTFKKGWNKEAVLNKKVFRFQPAP